MMEYKKTEDALRESFSMYNELVSNMPGGVYRFRMKALDGYSQGRTRAFVRDRWLM